MSKNIVILGGGTAGLITAIYIKKVLPQYDIKLVRSQEIGIVGVGEATTPHFVTTLKNLEIDIFECIRRTNASIKNGINFVNWNGDGESYFHHFDEWLVDWQVPGIFGSQCKDLYLKNLINENLPFKNYLYTELLSSKNYIDLENTAWSLHFDAGLMAQYLEDVAVYRGIMILDEIYQDCVENENGYISKLLFRSGKDLDCKFLFDCTGFHRTLIGGHFKEKWISYKEYLPMNKAIPFWLDSEDDIEPYTTSTAMKNGWMWKIPLTSRIGCGYIFDGNYCSVEQAKQEAEEYLGKEIQIRKILDFNPGKFKNIWVKNCMAIGLSSHFLEPIESTSLWLTVSQLNLFVHFLDDIENPNLDSQRTFNNIMSNSIDECMYFVYLHYVTKRNDSEFWKDFLKLHPVPEDLKTRLKLLKHNKLKYCDIGNDNAVAWFPLSSYLQVGRGLDLIVPTNDPFYNVSPNPTEYKHHLNFVHREKSYPVKMFLNDVNNKIHSS